MCCVSSVCRVYDVTNFYFDSNLVRLKGHRRHQDRRKVWKSGVGRVKCWSRIVFQGLELITHKKIMQKQNVNKQKNHLNWASNLSKVKTFWIYALKVTYPLELWNEKMECLKIRGGASKEVFNYSFFKRLKHITHCQNFHHVKAKIFWFSASKIDLKVDFI